MFVTCILVNPKVLSRRKLWRKQTSLLLLGGGLLLGRSLLLRRGLLLGGGLLFGSLWDSRGAVSVGIQC